MLPGLEPEDDGGGFPPTASILATELGFDGTEE